MAEGSGGKSASNVMSLDDARRKRQQNRIHEEHCTDEDVQHGVQSGEGATESHMKHTGSAEGKWSPQRTEAQATPVEQVGTAGSVLHASGDRSADSGESEAGNETVRSTATGQGKKRQRSFNREKVERIKAQIARGEYKINYFSVADKYIEHDRFA